MKTLDDGVYRQIWFGKSTDTKPTDCPNSSLWYEMDKQKVYMFDAEASVWIEQ